MALFCAKEWPELRAMLRAEQLSFMERKPPTKFEHGDLIQNYYHLMLETLHYRMRFWTPPDTAGRFNNKAAEIIALLERAVDLLGRRGR
jgi:hypothetical protein